MNKKLFQYCQKHLRDNDSCQLKVTPSLRQLVDLYNVGFIANGLFYYDSRDKQHLIEMVSIELHGIHLFRDPYPSPKTRDALAKINRSEKVGALKVSDEYILINTLGSLFINQQIIPMPPISSLGQYVRASEIESIEHKQIILVENLIVMANLARLKVPEQLKDALWLYRGDRQAKQQTGTAYPFFRRFAATHQLISFSDLDPSGLQISLTSGAAYWLTIANQDDLQLVLKGDEKEWFAQQNAITYLNNYSKKCQLLPVYCEQLLDVMKQSQKTLKQEHMIAHSLPLALYSL